MAVAVEVRIEGAKELQAKLSELRTGAQRRALRTAYRKAGNIVRNEARARAPRRTGRLKRNIQVRATANKVEIGFSKRAYYGQFQETGTSRHPAQPFLRPALALKKQEAVDAFAAALRAEIDRLAAAG